MVIFDEIDYWVNMKNDKYLHTSIDEIQERPNLHYGFKRVGMFTDLVNLDLVVPNDPAGDFNVICNMVFGPTDINLQDGTYEFSVEAATLTLGLSGWQANLVNKYASDPKADAIFRKKAIGSESVHSVGLKLDNFEISGGAKDSEITEIISKHSAIEVLPITNNRWLINSTNGDGMLGAAISNSTLCNLRPQGGGNFKKVTATLSVKPTQFKINTAKNSKKLNHPKLVKALVIKRLKEAGSAYPEINDGLTNVTIEQITISDQEEK